MSGVLARWILSAWRGSRWRVPGVSPAGRRLPTRDISPFRTLMNWESSSRPIFRRTFLGGKSVGDGSSRIRPPFFRPSAGEVPFPWVMNFITDSLWDDSSLLTCMDRNFRKEKVFPHCPGPILFEEFRPLEGELDRQDGGQEIRRKNHQPGKGSGDGRRDFL